MNMDGGGAVELVHNVDSQPDPHFSRDGKWVYYNSRDETSSRAFWKVSVDGGEPVKVRDRSICHLAPNGKSFACFYRDQAPDALARMLFVSADTGEVMRTLDWPEGANTVFWSPDGQAVDYISEREGLSNIWHLSLASGKERKLTDWQTPAPLWHLAWSRDGVRLAITRDTRRDQLILIQNFR